eukprot:gene1547-932_t
MCDVHAAVSRLVSKCALLSLRSPRFSVIIIIDAVSLTWPGGGGMGTRSISIYTDIWASIQPASIFDSLSLKTKIYLFLALFLLSELNEAFFLANFFLCRTTAFYSVQFFFKLLKREIIRFIATARPALSSTRGGAGRYFCISLVAFAPYEEATGNTREQEKPSNSHNKQHQEQNPFFHFSLKLNFFFFSFHERDDGSEFFKGAAAREAACLLSVSEIRNNNNERKKERKKKAIKKQHTHAHRWYNSNNKNQLTQELPPLATLFYSQATKSSRNKKTITFLCPPAFIYLLDTTKESKEKEPASDSPDRDSFEIKKTIAKKREKEVNHNHHHHRIHIEEEEHLLYILFCKFISFLTSTATILRSRESGVPPLLQRVSMSQGYPTVTKGAAEQQDLPALVVPSCITQLPHFLHSSPSRSPVRSQADTPDVSTPPPKAAAPKHELETSLPRRSAGPTRGVHLGGVNASHEADVHRGRSTPGHQREASESSPLERQVSSASFSAPCGIPYSQTPPARSGGLRREAGAAPQTVAELAAAAVRPLSTLSSSSSLSSSLTAGSMPGGAPVHGHRPYHVRTPSCTNWSLEAFDAGSGSVSATAELLAGRRREQLGGGLPRGPATAAAPPMPIAARPPDAGGPAAALKNYPLQPLPFPALALSATAPPLAEGEVPCAIGLQRAIAHEPYASTYPAPTRLSADTGATETSASASPRRVAFREERNTVSYPDASHLCRSSSSSSRGSTSPPRRAGADKACIGSVRGRHGTPLRLGGAPLPRCTSPDYRDKDGRDGSEAEVGKSPHHAHRRRHQRHNGAASPPGLGEEEEEEAEAEGSEPRRQPALERFRFGDDLRLPKSILKRTGTSATNSESQTTTYDTTGSSNGSQPPEAHTDPNTALELHPDGGSPEGHDPASAEALERMLQGVRRLSLMSLSSSSCSSGGSDSTFPPGGKRGAGDEHTRITRFQFPLREHIFCSLLLLDEQKHTSKKKNNIYERESTPLSIKEGRQGTCGREKTYGRILPSTRNRYIIQNLRAYSELRQGDTLLIPLTPLLMDVSNAPPLRPPSPRFFYHI